MRQVEHHRCRALGDGRDFRKASARRLDGGRHIQRVGRPQAAGRGVGRTGVRQQPGQDRRCVRELQRGVAAPFGASRWNVRLLHQRHQGAPQGHHADVSRHGSGFPQLCHHRAGHDLAGDRGAAGRSARVPGGGGGHLALQGAAPRDGEPDRSDAREPGSSERLARGGRKADAPPAAAGGDGAAVSGAQGGGAQAAGGTAGAAAAGSGRGIRSARRGHAAAAKPPCRACSPSCGRSRPRSNGSGSIKRRRPRP